MKLLAKAGLIFLVGLIVYYRLFGNGVPLTHDGPMHVVRMASFYQALQQGQIPPRLGPNLANGLGYPVFNYNYPLANIVAVPFIRLHLNYENVYQIVVFILILLGMVGTVQLVKSYHTDFKHQIIAAVLYAANPFLISQVFVRGGVGEIAYIGLFPWMLWLIQQTLTKDVQVFRNQFFVGVVGGLIALSHNVLFVFGLPILAIYSVWLSRKSWSKIVRLVVPGFVAILISAFFWIPALGEKSLVVLDDSPITAGYFKHFLRIHQLISGYWDYGFSRPGPVDGLSFSLSMIELGLLTLITVDLVSKSRKRVALSLWVITILCFGLTLSTSAPIWKLIPFGFYIQFPWRMLWFGHFFLILLVVKWLRESKINGFWLSAIVIVSIGMSLSKAVPSQRVNRTEEEWLRAGETTSTTNENTPKTLDLNKAYQVIDEVFGDKLAVAATSSASIIIDRWDGSSRSYKVVTPVPTIVTERTAYYPGWETQLNNQKIAIGPNDPWKAGLISYQIEAGSYLVTTKFTQHTPARLLGNLLTGLGIVLCGLGIWKMRKK